jgi:hypothetical protein
VPESTGERSNEEKILKYNSKVRFRILLNHVWLIVVLNIAVVVSMVYTSVSFNWY